MGAAGGVSYEPRSPPLRNPYEDFGRGGLSVCASLAAAQDGQEEARLRVTSGGAGLDQCAMFRCHEFFSRQSAEMPSARLTSVDWRAVACT